MNDNKQHLLLTTAFSNVFMDPISNSTNGTETIVDSLSQQSVPTLSAMMMEIYHNPASEPNPIAGNVSFTATELLREMWPTSQIVSLPDVAWSTTDEFNDPGYTLRYGLLGSVVLSIAYGLVLVVGLCGNVAVCLVILRSRNMRSATNLFIANLAIADILVNLLCLPFTLIGNLFPAWILGIFFCKTVSYLQGVSVSASVNTLAAISIERCAAITFPLSGTMNSRHYKFAVTFIWLVALTINLPWLFVFTLEPLEGSMAKVCIELWPTQQSGNWYFVFANLIVCYLLPLLIISLCYIIIWRKVSNRGLPHEIIVNRKHDVYLKSKVKVLKMVLVVVITFALSWLPLYALCVFIKFFWDLVAYDDDFTHAISIALPIAQWFGAANSCINPLLYAFLNRKFRSGFKDIFNKSFQQTSTNDFEAKDIQVRRVLKTMHCNGSCHGRNGYSTQKSLDRSLL